MSDQVKALISCHIKNAIIVVCITIAFVHTRSWLPFLLILCISSIKSRNEDDCKSDSEKEERKSIR